MKTNLIGLAVATALVTSVCAFADDYDENNYNAYNNDNQPSDVQGQPCAQPTQPASVSYQNQGPGRYVTQPVQQWVPGRYEQVYVSNCPGGSGFARCHSGRLVNR